MKKILVLACFLAAAAACSTEPSGNKNATANTNMAPAPKTSADSAAEITAKEKASWDLIKKKDWDGFGKTLTSDYIEVLDDGVRDKTATLTTIKDFDLSDVTFSDWKTISV